MRGRWAQAGETGERRAGKHLEVTICGQLEAEGRRRECCGLQLTTRAAFKGSPTMRVRETRAAAWHSRCGPALLSGFRSVQS